MKKLAALIILSTTLFACDLSGILGASGPIQDALEYCISYSIDNLGVEDGFLSDSIVKIPLPDEIESIMSNSAFKTALSSIDQADLDDNFVEAMNRAAEAAVADGETLTIFTSAVTSLTIDDARSILYGTVTNTTATDEEVITETPYAATIYLKSKTYDGLQEKFATIIDPFFDQDLAGDFSVNDLYGYLQQAVELANAVPLVELNFDLEADTIGDYVVAKTLDGLFYKIGVYELEVRENFSNFSSSIAEAFGDVDANNPDLKNAVQNGLDALLP